MLVTDGVTTLVLLVLLLVLVHVLPKFLASQAYRGAADCDEGDNVNLTSDSVADANLAWRILRAEGFISNAIVCAVVLCLFAAFRHCLVSLMIPFNTEVLWKVPTVYALDTGRNLIGLAMQQLLNCHWYKMTSADLSMIRLRRDKWTEGLETGMLLDRYGYFPVKIMDAVNRRAGHLLYYAIHVAVLSFGNVSSGSTLQVFFYLAVFRTFMRVILEYNDCLGVVDYLGARMRDGRCGRFNLLVACVWGGFGKVVLVMLLVINGLSGEDDFRIFQAYSVLALQGVIWGDTAGEVVGSFFGRIEFNVGGFGETNRKTVEGTVAVWLATAISSLCVYSAWLADDMQIQSNKLSLICCISTVVTIMEVAAPRGTDNFFILVGSVACVVFFI